MALESRALLSTFTVNSMADDGSVGTLRWAIGQANASSEADSIAFSSLFNAPQTINLTAGQLKLFDTAPGYSRARRDRHGWRAGPACQHD
jgi:hypothetical protein